VPRCGPAGARRQRGRAQLPGLPSQGRPRCSLREKTQRIGGPVDTLMLGHVAVWLDELAPQCGAFADAVDLALPLGLPLDALAAPAVGTLEACAAACARKGVAWDASLWQGPPHRAAERFLGLGGLCAFGGDLPPALTDAFVRSSWGSTQTALLVCPRAW